MKDQRPKSEKSALRHETQRLGTLRAELVDGFRFKTAGAMRAIDDAHRTVVFGTRIEMDTDRQHPLENIDRWLTCGTPALSVQGP